ncbi:tigger transposable element-derived protein 2-like [Colletes gigas]|uniref:tigger transposable element-derived protein 2-like n=1 Tax=Colletes gigas TaxID=935657 RepID=UPI001C9B5DA4|nr:tigger transposable element-derived protein 2-like [Colletes gigas]
MASVPPRKEQNTVAKRLEILQKFEKGVPVEQLAAEYGINRRTIYRYRNNAASIREFSENPNSMDLKKKPTLLHEDVNNRLYAWIIEKQASGEILTDTLLQKKARELHAEFAGPSNFTASRGWLKCFKRRHGMHLTSIHGEKPKAHELATEKFVEELSAMLDQENIDEENVYNVDETSLMWKALPQRTLAHEGEHNTKDRKVKKDRVSVVFCTNATGTHKLPPLFINKYAHPRALKHCILTLPVVYKSQNNACIDETVFNDWFTNHFKLSVWQHQMQNYQEGKVLLLIGNCKGHMPSQQPWEDSRFKVVFLPPNASSVIQPLDQGIIAECKKLFRHNLLRRVLRYDGIRQFYADYDIKDCIDLISEAWNEITATSIKNSWRKLLNRPLSAESPEEQDSKVNIEQNSGQLGGSIPTDEIIEWFSECDKAESTVTEEEEMDRTFNALLSWAETKPKRIKLHAQFLVDYYNLK